MRGFGRPRKDFPKGHVPQGFVCFPVRHVGERSLPATSKYGELEVVTRIKRPMIGGRAVSGPYLFFGVVALTTRAARIRVRAGLGAAHLVGPPPGAGGLGFRAPGLRDAHDDTVDVGQGIPGYRVHDGEAGVRHRHQARAVPAGLPDTRPAEGARCEPGWSR